MLSKRPVLLLLVGAHKPGRFLSSTSFGLSQQRAGALLDRLTHHVYILDISGDSYRLKASLKRQKRKAGQPKE